jgi:putative sugar O-methyltransferase
VNLEPGDLQAMIAEVEEEGGLLKPSRFWEQLAGRNAATLIEQGIDSFKRTVNFNYFQWVINSPRQPEFASVIRAWARHPSMASLRCRVCVEGVDWERPRSPKQLPVRWRPLGHAIYVGMLWHIAVRRASGITLDGVGEPELGDPIAICWRDRRISEDLANSLLEYSGIAEHAPGSRLTAGTLLEIGAGYGRFADLFLMVNTSARVVIVDIPPALALSQAYLTARWPQLPAHTFRRGLDSAALAKAVSDNRLVFLTPNQLAEAEPLGADLAVNISSLHEMRPEQVAEFLRLIDRHAGGGFFYTKQWERWFNPVDGVEMVKASYPYPATWQKLFDRKPVAQPAFFEALYAL